MKRVRNIFLKAICAPALVMLISFSADAQSVRTYRVAVFAPLYLDSVFTDDGYKYGKTFPKFTQQGFDFVQGAQAAFDSLPVSKANIRASIFDSKAYSQNIPYLISNHALDSMDLLIGSVKDAEFGQLASFAKQKNIPFISATYPNDAGVTGNPFLVIVNSTLRAHCETIFGYLLQNHGTDNILLVRKKGTQEDKIADYFKQINEGEGKPLLNIKTVFAEDDFSVIKSKLDSTKKNVIIGGSLNEEFADQLVSTAYSLKKQFSEELIGMPNWDAFEDLRKTAYKDFPVLYTTAYVNTKTDAFSKRVQAVWLKKFKGIPSDMSYKGYESAFLFTRLLAAYPDDFMSHLNSSSPKVFCDYNFQPVYTTKKKTVPDFFENKHLYFMKIVNGKVVKAW